MVSKIILIQKLITGLNIGKMWPMEAFFFLQKAWIVAFPFAFLWEYVFVIFPLHRRIGLIPTLDHQTASSCPRTNSCTAQQSGEGLQSFSVFISFIHFHKNTLHQDSIHKMTSKWMEIILHTCINDIDTDIMLSLNKLHRWGDKTL